MRHLTIAEAAEALQLSVPTIKRYIYDGKLRSTKLPGGQHRIPETEVERLLAGDEAVAPGTPRGPVPGAEVEDRVAVLERWVTELEAEVERLSGALEVMARFLAPPATATAPPAAPADADEPCRIAVLGPGCRRCKALYERTHRVVRAIGGRLATVEMISDLDDIVAYGPLLTPALTVGDTVVLAGRVPSEAALRKILEPYLAAG